MHKPRVRINHQIKAPELVVIGPAGENFGVLSLTDALGRAHALGLDLIEISPNATPPVGRITEYGKFLYAESKKRKASRGKQHQAEVKEIQVRIGTSEHDLELKAKKASEWLREGHRIKVDLFLPGRAKYLDEKFLKERLGRMLLFLTESYKISDPARKSPKGLTMMIER